ncbi:MAG TPA: hypothetical protein PK141_03230 [Polyangiaceae bacterium]|jgi:TPR repeat protein|nr:hypothetical protein [Polyangiaceae bacterium]
MRSFLVFGCGALVSLSAVASCGAPAGQLGESVRPKAATGHEALGEANIAACAKAIAGEPLVVDLKSSERSDLEVAMRDGVVVVGFDCKSLKIVKSCAAPGGYRFAGVTRKEDVVRMTSADELAANLPLSGASISAGMKRGSTLDLALVTVGKKRATASEITKSDLTGSGCAEATHVVRGVYVGAFALATGTEGEVRAVAQIFGAGTAGSSAAGKKTEARDGELDACRKSTPDANAPPEQCAAITRLELVPIVAEKKDPKDHPKAETAEAHAPACPEGFAWDGLKCVGGKATAKACSQATGTKEECSAGCSAGNGESCFVLGLYAGSPPADPTTKIGRRPVPPAQVDAAALTKGCSLGYAPACMTGAHSDLGALYRPGVAEAEKAAATGRAGKAFEAACNLGDAYGCLDLADFYDPNQPERVGFAKSVDKLVGYVKRACDLGNGRSCGRLGDMHRDGKGAKEDSSLAIAAYERQCSAGGYSDGDGCYKIGAIYANGKGLPADPTKALSAFDRACSLRNMFACMAGHGLAVTAQDSGRARSMLERGCNKDVRGWEPCLALGEAYEKGGLGLQRDFAKAAEAYELGCAKGACARAGELYRRGGNGLTASPEKALHAFEAGCSSWSEPKACAGQEAILKTKSKDELVKFYELRCEQRNDARACLRLKAAGGNPKEETLKRYLESAKMGCQRMHYGDECKLWKELGGAPTAAELKQPTREETLKKSQAGRN